MKETKIQSLHSEQIAELIPDLFEKISLWYDIRAADPKFTIYFIKLLKKEYLALTFEQIELAFEYNAHGLNNHFFNRTGNRADNKIKSFNLPDLVKIINAHVKYLGSKKTKEQTFTKHEFAKNEKHEIFNKWFDSRIKDFELYRASGEMTRIVLPVFVLSLYESLGLIEPDKIDSSTDMTCEQLVYNCYDRLIQKGESLEGYFKNERNKYL